MFFHSCTAWDLAIRIQCLGIKVCGRGVATRFGRLPFKGLEGQAVEGSPRVWDLGLGVKGRGVLLTELQSLRAYGVVALGFEGFRISDSGFWSFCAGRRTHREYTAVFRFTSTERFSATIQVVISHKQHAGLMPELST